jgi:hypothetical protein
MQIKDLTTEDLKTLIRETVQAVLDDYLDDPDAGLSMRPAIESQLAAAQARRASGQRGVPAAEVAKQQFGLDANDTIAMPAQPKSNFFDQPFIQELIQNPPMVVGSWKMTRNEMYDR